MDMPRRCTQHGVGADVGIEQAVIMIMQAAAGQGFQPERRCGFDDQEAFFAPRRDGMGDEPLQRAGSTPSGLDMGLRRALHVAKEFHDLQTPDPAVDRAAR